MRMIHGRGGASLAFGSFQRMRVVGKIFGQEFQRDQAAESAVLSFVDHIHTAATELLEDVVMGDGLPEK